MTLSRWGDWRVIDSMDRDSELQLVEALRLGDPAAFDAVHAAFNGRLFNFLARLSNRRDVAEDLLEETWLRLVKHAARLHPDTRLGPWLFTIARHLHASYCRSRLLEDSHASGLLGLWPQGPACSTPFDIAEANETERRLATGLACFRSSIAKRWWCRFEGLDLGSRESAGSTEPCPRVAVTRVLPYLRT